MAIELTDQEREESFDAIPTSKVAHASKLIKTGLKVGVNYLSYYGEKVVNPEGASERLHENNAKDIYQDLKELKGSALKVAQMLSMDKNVLPKAYSDRFSLAQFQVPPLSGPLVMKTLKAELGKPGDQLFDKFDPKAARAASIGQVHRAEKNGKALAVKIQYPGVADSIQSDLRLVKPIAMRMFDLKGKNIDVYFKEVEGKLLEETDYKLELQRANQIAEACSALSGLLFPHYYEDLSSGRVLTMDWIEGKHLTELGEISKEEGSRLGQVLWDFFLYQIYELKIVHADPHPGNFLVTKEGHLGVLDFGCVKEVPEDFYKHYFKLIRKEMLEDQAGLEYHLEQLEILRSSDSKEERDFFLGTFKTLLLLLGRPLHQDRFDFADKAYFAELLAFGEAFAKEAKSKSLDTARGSRHFIYVNRTLYGLYNLMQELGAEVETRRYQPKV